MAESADILTSDAQQVILPDLAAGCSMADMAAINQVEDAWDTLADLGIAARTVPVTYMNSAAAIKAFTRRHGGTVCTSSNAATALRWAFDKVGGAGGTGKVLFMPDQHLGRNTAVRELGLSLADCVVFDPCQPGGLVPAELEAARMILWRGHCSVHGRFSVRDVGDIRAAVPGVTVLAALPGHTRTSAHHLDSTVCFCSTMNRIDLPHLVWAMESLVARRTVNRVVVDSGDAHWARVALAQMLALPGH